MNAYKLTHTVLLGMLLILPALGAAGSSQKTPAEDKNRPLTPSNIPLNTGAQPQTEDIDQAASVSGSVAGEQINWQVMGGGGGPCAAGGYQINGTLGQPIAGWTATSSHSIHQGYWQSFMATGDCCDLPGDFNGDGVVHNGDNVFLIYYLFRYGPAPPCLNEADANIDCLVDLADVVWLINYIFRLGPPPQCGCAE